MIKVETSVPDNVGHIASEILTATGLTVAEAVRLFLTRIATEGALPLDWHEPGAQTLAAMQDARAGRVESTSIDAVLETMDTYRAQPA